MPSSWCPHCQSVQPTDVTDAEYEEQNENNETIRVHVANYHCAKCRLFMYSQETRTPAKAPAAQQKAVE